jgi:hypothetical protein
MPINSSGVGKALEAEIVRIAQPELVACIRKHLVQLRCEQREWDYGSPGLSYPCWIFAEHPASNTAFAYCEQGFGPGTPWGLLSIRGQHMSIGMDSAWFAGLEGVFRDSMAWDGVDPPGYEVS